MRNFEEKERTCEASFASVGPYWHAYTNGRDTPLTFTRDVDFTLVMNVIALAAAALDISTDGLLHNVLSSVLCKSKY